MFEFDVLSPVPHKQSPSKTVTQSWHVQYTYMYYYSNVLSTFYFLFLAFSTFQSQEQSILLLHGRCLEQYNQEMSAYKRHQLEYDF